MFSFGLHDAQAAKKALPPPSNSVTDEDVQKRNTDCIYFLASPLTCKKGTNCEYRHSEAARLNPRDCRFWKAGNCLNPRCSFRHLPLDEKSASAASIASTSSAPIISQLVAATSSSNKSQTPCYFFSQGYCAKNDKCPFMHGLSAAPGGDTDTQKNLAAELNSKAGYGRPVAANGSYTLSKVPITLQEIPQKSNGLEKSTAFESNKTYVKSGAPLKFRKPMVQVDRPYDDEQSQLGQQRLQDKGDNDGTFVHPNNRQGNAWPVDPYAFQSDSHPITKSPSNSVGSNGRASLEQSRSDCSEELSEEVLQSHAFRGHLQASSKYASDPRVTAHDKPEKFRGQKMSLERDASTDLRNHLMKRQKINGFLAVSQKIGIRGYTGITTRGNGSQWRTEDHHAHQQEGKFLAKAVNTEGKVAKSDGTERSMLLQKVSTNGTSSTDKCPTQGNNRHEASGGTFIREVATFMGPKSLAQIKAEKMASASKLLGKDNSRTITAEAGTKLAARKLELHIGVSSDKHIAITKSALKENTATMAEFEGPKPLSMLLERKRELDSQHSDSRDTMPVPYEAEVLTPCQTEVSMPVKAEPLKAVVSMPDTSEELEDGEVGYESVGFLQESLPSPSCLAKEHVEVMSPISREVLQRAGVELAESEMESLEDGLKSDAEMEDIDYDDAGCGIIDEDDDDDDFAKKLGRYFTFTSN